MTQLSQDEDTAIIAAFHSTLDALMATQIALGQKLDASTDPQEQNELTAFLFHLRHRRNAAYQATLTARMGDKDPSHWLTPEEFEKRLDTK